MGLRDLLRKKDRLQQDGHYSPDTRAETIDRLGQPEFTFIRTDTNTQEIIHPPSTPATPADHSSPASFLNPQAEQQQQQQQQHQHQNQQQHHHHHHHHHQKPPTSAGGSSISAASTASGRSQRRSIDLFNRSGRSRGNSDASARSTDSQQKRDQQQHLGANNNNKESAARRLSHRLRLSSPPKSSEFVPENLPEINVSPADGYSSGGVGGSNGVNNSSSSSGGDRANPQVANEENSRAEQQWENRATILAEQNRTRQRSRSIASPTQSPIHSPTHHHVAGFDLGEKSSGSSGNGVVSSKVIDEQIQAAIDFHEAGKLEQSTELFGRLADPAGANNPLSQVLYGLALRHGWGCVPDPGKAITYLSAAASNAADVETMALKAGLKKGGAAKGELVLAIFELANCFRNGWGIPKDSVAAKQYYETAANLGDTDAMNEVAWCYLEGFGCKKDKRVAARYYRLAEQNGNKTLGNTWIWKDKYNPK